MLAKDVAITLPSKKRKKKQQKTHNGRERRAAFLVALE